jgi:hypothetical protein
VTDQCIFCERLSGSQEHAWPDWVVKHATERRKDWQLEIVRLGSPLITVDQVNREIEVVVDCVCDRCNRGWMKKLEDRVSVFGKAMMDGRPTILTWRDRDHLARWAAKTAFTVECKYGGPHRAPRSICEALRAGPGIPPMIDVMLGAYSGPRPIRSERLIYRFDGLDGDQLYMSWSFLQFGHVLIQVRAVPGRKEHPMLLVEATDRCIPLTGVERGQVQWPPKKAVGEEILSDFRAISDEIIRRGGGFRNARTARSD